MTYKKGDLVRYAVNSGATGGPFQGELGVVVDVTHLAYRYKVYWQGIQKTAVSGQWEIESV